MQDLEARIESIEGKVRQLLLKAKAIKEENDVLRQENIKLKEELEECIQGSSQDSAMDEKTSVQSDNEQIKYIRSELSNYIEVVDECIKML